MSPRLERLRARFAPLRVRLTLAVAVLSLIALTSGAALLVWAVRATLFRGIERANDEELRMFEHQVERGVPPDVLELPPGFVRPAPPLPRVLHPPGHPAPLMLLAPRAAPSALPPAGPGFGAGWSVKARAVQSPSEGPFVIAVGRPLLEAERSVESMTRVLSAGVPLLVLVTTLAAWVLVGRALSPVHAMSSGASRIADATSGERLQVPATNDEVSTLAKTLNGMLDRIAAGTRRQREFVSDASHELRSPIAAIKTLLEVELAHPARTEPKALHAALLSETLRLETLSADLLALARLDEEKKPRDDEVDLDDVVLEESARPRRLSIDTRGVAATKTRGDRSALMHLVRNLLDNAARHARSRVGVSTRTEDGRVVLYVDDDGPGIAEADRARVFERFTRSEADRSRHTGGAGLGLAVVRRIAEQHGGTVRAETSPEGGARIELCLPALGDAETGTRDTA